MQDFPARAVFSAFRTMSKRKRHPGEDPRIFEFEAIPIPIAPPHRSDHQAIFRSRPPAGARHSLTAAPLPEKSSSCGSLVSRRADRAFVRSNLHQGKIRRGDRPKGFCARDTLQSAAFVVAPRMIRTHERATTSARRRPELYARRDAGTDSESAEPCRRGPERRAGNGRRSSAYNNLPGSGPRVRQAYDRYLIRCMNFVHSIKRCKTRARCTHRAQTPPANSDRRSKHGFRHDSASLAAPLTGREISKYFDIDV